MFFYELTCKHKTKIEEKVALYLPQQNHLKQTFLL